MSMFLYPFYVAKDGKISLANGRPWGERCIEWVCGGKKRVVFDASITSAAIDPVLDLMVVSVHSEGREYIKPNNAVVFNPDATVDHQIKAPRHVFKGDYVKGAGWVEPPHDDDMEVSFPPGSDTWVGVEVPGAGVCYRVEEISHVCIKSGRLVIGLRFGYDWCEERFYDAGKRQWLERAGIYPFGMRG